MKNQTTYFLFILLVMFSLSSCRGDKPKTDSSPKAENTDEGKKKPKKKGTGGDKEKSTCSKMNDKFVETSKSNRWQIFVPDSLNNIDEVKGYKSKNTDAIKTYWEELKKYDSCRKTKDFVKAEEEIIKAEKQFKALWEKFDRVSNPVIIDSVIGGWHIIGPAGNYFLANSCATPDSITDTLKLNLILELSTDNLDEIIPDDNDIVMTITTNVKNIYYGNYSMYLEAFNQSKVSATKVNPDIFEINIFKNAKRFRVPITLDGRSACKFKELIEDKVLRTPEFIDLIIDEFDIQFTRD